MHITIKKLPKAVQMLKICAVNEIGASVKSVNFERNLLL